jgi:tetratricopeptide (TPR) repeat protein
VGACFFLILAPTSSFIPVGTQVGAEHRMYLPLAAVVTFAVLALRWVALRLPWRWVRYPAQRAWAGRIATAAVALVLGTLTYQRNQDYRSGVSIWSDTVRKRPDNPRAHYNLGRHLVDAGRFAEALHCFRRTVALQPDFPDAHLNLGCAYAALGDHQAALAQYAEAIAVAPGNAENYYDRGNTYFELGQYESALRDYDEAIARNPAHAQAHYRRGLSLQKLNHTDEAIASYTQAIRLNPAYAAPFGERAISYYVRRQYDLAWRDIRRFQQLGGTPNPQFMQRLMQASSRVGEPSSRPRP